MDINEKTLIERVVRDDLHLEKVIREIVRSIKVVSYGSVEIVIQNSRVVQIERKEKLRLDRD
jgi:hypothetical protein